MENPIKMDDLGGKPTIFGNIHFFLQKTKGPHCPFNKSDSQGVVQRCWRLEMKKTYSRSQRMSDVTKKQQVSTPQMFFTNRYQQWQCFKRVTFSKAHYVGEKKVAMLEM